MKIGIDIRNIGKKRTGDEVVFFNLVKNLAEIDNFNQYLLFTDITDSLILRSIRENLGIENKDNFEIISLACQNKFIWNAWTLPKYLRQNPVDIYHTQYILPFFVSHKIKLVTTVHDISFNFYPQYIKWPDLFFLKVLIPVSLRRADKVIVVSQFTKDEIVKYYKIDPRKVEVAYNAAADNFFQNIYSEKQRERVKIKYNLPEKFILYIGTMQPRKNLPFLIEAYGEIKNKLAGVKLVIAGKKSNNYDRKIDDIMAKCDLKNDVLFPGYIDEEDKPILFNLSLYFVFPSFYEGFGITVLEAMSQKVPVLAADIPGLHEVAEKAALYFNPQRLAGLKETMYNIFIDNNLRDELVNNGLGRIQFFSWTKTAEQTLEIYKSLT